MLRIRATTTSRKTHTTRNIKQSKTNFKLKSKKKKCSSLFSYLHVILHNMFSFRSRFSIYYSIRRNIHKSLVDLWRDYPSYHNKSVNKQIQGEKE